MTIFLYLVKCKTKNHYYVGITIDSSRRFFQHSSGKGARFTKKHGFISAKVLETFFDIVEARKAEGEKVIELRALHPDWTVAGGPHHKQKQSRSVPHSHEPWGYVEDNLLSEESAMGYKIADLAKMHGRSRGAIQSRLIKLGLSLILESQTYDRTHRSS